MKNTITLIKRSIGRPFLPSSFILIAVALAGFGLALAPNAFGVVPTPDGGYPGGNTAEGQGALFSLTTGTFNTAVGMFSLRSNTESSFNTGVGAGALLLNTAPYNTATGAGALLSNTIGDTNTATGAFALFSNTEGNENAATGFRALFSNTTGGGNTATGDHALNSNTTGDANTAVGAGALYSNTSGSNTAIGLGALGFNTQGNSNTAAGRDALDHNTTGNGNTALGIFAGSNVTTANNVIAIGHTGANVNNSCYIANIFGATIDPSSVFVGIDSSGKLGTVASSRRFKEEIQPMDEASQALLSLKPVTFRYKNYKHSPRQFGLIAEEVAEVNSDLVARDKNGEIYTVRYDQINAMLLNEFLKEHRRVQAQQATISELKSSVAQQQKGMEALTAQLREQAAQIQKVSARIAINRPAPHMVINR